MENHCPVPQNQEQQGSVAQIVALNQPGGPANMFFPSIHHQFAGFGRDALQMNAVTYGTAYAEWLSKLHWLCSQNVILATSLQYHAAGFGVTQAVQNGGIHEAEQQEESQGNRQERNCDVQRVVDITLNEAGGENTAPGDAMRRNGATCSTHSPSVSPSDTSSEKCVFVTRPATRKRILKAPKAPEGRPASSITREVTKAPVSKRGGPQAKLSPKKRQGGKITVVAEYSSSDTESEDACSNVSSVLRPSITAGRGRGGRGNRGGGPSRATNTARSKRGRGN